MKRSIVLALAFCILLIAPLLSSSASAADEGKLLVSCPETVSCGDGLFAFSFTVTPPGGKGIGGYLIELSFDPSVFQVVSGGDSVQNGRIRFCDSADSPLPFLTFTVTFSTHAPYDGAFEFTRVQLVDFDTVTSFSVSAPATPIRVMLDPQGRGDLDQNGRTDSDDAIFLLFHTLFGDAYSLPFSGDMDKSGDVNSDDAIRLLFFTLFPSQYPLL